MTVRDCAIILRRRWVTVVTAIAILVALGGSFVTWKSVGAQPDRVEARLLVLGELVEKEQYYVDTSTAAGELTRALADTLMTSVALGQIRDESNLKISLKKLSEVIELQVSEGVPVLSISVEGEEATSRTITAAVIKVAGSTLDVLVERRFSGDAGVSTRLIMEPTVRERPDVAVVPVLGFTLILGLALGVTAAFVRDALDGRVRTAGRLRERLPDDVLVIDGASDDALRRVRAALLDRSPLPAVGVATSAGGRSLPGALAGELAESLRSAGLDVVELSARFDGALVTAEKLAAAVSASDEVALPAEPRAFDDLFTPAALDSLVAAAAAAERGAVLALPDVSASVGAESAVARLDAVVVDVDLAATSMATVTRFVDGLREDRRERLVLVVR
ncbi:hypothetical protein [Sanguibacter massiliensis]|uniref:hypothetical protein n=1 Tax=Sanguibacter massiliensis TaxID=1973217 RepID=UPI00101AD644|nr:hypothetical protein [Sanguibacter massiliensis]